MITLPSAPVEPDARCGFRTSTPFFIARAATNISGTKISPFLNFSPTTDIALIIPSLRIATGSSPSSIASCTAGPTNFAFPFSTNSATSFILDIIKSSCYFLISDSNHLIHLHSFFRFSLFLLRCTNQAFSVSPYIFHTIIIQTK